MLRIEEIAEPRDAGDLLADQLVDEAAGADLVLFSCARVEVLDKVFPVPEVLVDPFLAAAGEFQPGLARVNVPP